MGGSQGGTSADNSRHGGDDFELEYTYNPHRGQNSGSFKGTPDSSQVRMRSLGAAAGGLK